MIQRKRRHLRRVLNRQAEDFKTIPLQLLRDELGKGFREGKFSDAGLDGDFPNARDAQQAFTVSSLQ